MAETVAEGVVVKEVGARQGQGEGGGLLLPYLLPHKTAKISKCRASNQQGLLRQVAAERRPAPVLSTEGQDGVQWLQWVAVVVEAAAAVRIMSLQKLCLHIHQL